MSEKYYLSPFQQLYRIGGGRFSLIGPGIESNTARLAIYGVWSTDVGNQFQVVNPVSLNGYGKGWCLAWVRNDDDTIHPLIAADGQNNLLPFGPTDLNSQVSTLGGGQIVSVNLWEGHLLDATWITPTTLVREILGYALRIMLACGQLGVDYPETDLSLKWSTLTNPRRNSIIAWLQSKGLPTGDINNNTPVRTVVTRISQADFGAIQFGNESF